MEILGFIGIIIVIIVFRIAVNAGARTTVAAARTAFGNDSFRENMQREFHGMVSFAVRLRFEAESEEQPFDHYRIECRGLIPVTRPRNISFVASLIDVTDSESKPVMCVVDDFQEPDTIAFQHRVDGPRLQPDQGLRDWVPMGGLIPEIIVPPRRGRRLMKVVVRVVDRDMRPDISLGFGGENDPAVITAAIADLEHEFTVQGYEEAAADSDRARVATVRLAVAMAMADGHMDDSEGEVIRTWITKQLSSLSGDHREEAKQACNDALRSAYGAGVEGNLSLSTIVEELNDIDNETAKYNAVELCLDVMAADGEADPEELVLVQRLAESLGLDYEELQKMKDKRMITLDLTMSDGASPEELLGIEEGWTPDQINRHLRSEFAKWNGRLNNLENAEERANAQRMLDLISEVRKRYAA